MTHQNKSYSQYLIALPLSFLCLISLATVQAAVITQDDLLFSTTDASMWGAGTSVTPLQSANSFSWNDTAGFHGITGSANEVIWPEITGERWVPDGYWGTEEVCDPTGLLGCGDVDVWVDTSYWETYVITPEITADTRTGFAFSAATSGNIGITSDMDVTHGTVDAEVEFSASITSPDVASTHMFYDLRPESSIVSGSLTADFAQLRGTLTTDLALNLDIDTTVCAFGFGCGETSLTPIDVNLDDFELLEMNISPDLVDQASIFGLDDLAFDATILRVFADAVVSPETGALLPSLSLPGLSVPGVGFNVGELVLDLPNQVTETFPADGDRLVSENTFDDVVSLAADLDGLYTMTTGGGLGGLVFNVGSFPLSASLRLDAWDVGIGPTVDLTQNFEFEPTLMVRLDFSHNVLMEFANGVTEEVDHWVGAFEDIPLIALLEAGVDVIVSPTYWIENIFTNTVSLDIGATAFFDTLGLHVFAPGGVPLYSNELFEVNVPFLDLGSIEVYNETFSLGGFGSRLGDDFVLRADYTFSEFTTVQGPPVSIGGIPGTAPGPSGGSGSSPVPLPNTLLLILVGIIGMVIAKSALSHRVRT